MEVTERDRILFTKLQTYGLLTTSQIGSMVFRGVRLTTVLRRLRKLEEDGYIQRITNLAGEEVAWAVIKRGALYVGDRPFKRHFRLDVRAHDMKLTDLRLALEGTGISRFWTPEHEIRSKVAGRYGLRGMKDRVVPDGLMGVHVQGVAESVAVELELHFKNQGRYYRTFKEYQNKSNTWAVWYVVSTPGLGESLMRFWKKTNPHSLGPRFCWSLLTDVLEKPLEAKVHSADRDWKIPDVWKPEIKIEPAQPPAQEESISYLVMKMREGAVKSQKDEEILAPAV